MRDLAPHSHNLAFAPGSKWTLTSDVKLDGEYKVLKVLGMIRRGGAVLAAIRWAGFAAVGDTWEPVENVLLLNKVHEFTHGPTAPVPIELGKYYLRATIFNSLSGRKQNEKKPYYKHAINVPQLCYDELAIAVLHDLAQIEGCSLAKETTHEGTIYILTVNTLDAAADFLLTHVAKPDIGNGSLRFVSGAAGYLDMTKLLPGTFVEYLVPAVKSNVPSFASRKATVYVFTAIFNGLSGTPTWPAIIAESERLTLAEQDAIVQHAKLELRQSWSVAPLPHPLRTTWAALAGDWAGAPAAGPLAGTPRGCAVARQVAQEVIGGGGEECCLCLFHNIRQLVFVYI